MVITGWKEFERRTVDFVDLKFLYAVKANYIRSRRGESKSGDRSHGEIF